MGRVDALSEFLAERSGLRRKAGDLARRIAAENAIIRDESVEGKPLEEALARQDELLLRAADCRARLEAVEGELRRLERARPAAGPVGFSEEIGEDGLAVGSIQRLTW